MLIFEASALVYHYFFPIILAHHSSPSLQIYHHYIVNHNVEFQPPDTSMTNTTVSGMSETVCNLTIELLLWLLFTISDRSHSNIKYSCFTSVKKGVSIRYNYN